MVPPGIHSSTSAAIGSIQPTADDDNPAALPQQQAAGIGGSG
jgi:hypothetical protein